MIFSWHPSSFLRLFQRKAKLYVKAIINHSIAGKKLVQGKRQNPVARDDMDTI